MNLNEKDNDNENEQKEENSDIIQIPINLKEENYIIKIYKSKDNSKIIFKAELKNIQTFYFYEKFDLKDFHHQNNQFIQIKNIEDAFNILKGIVKTNSTKLEQDSIKMNVLFFNESKTIATFCLRKKSFSQNRFNLLLIEQIQNNKSKIKSLKKQAIKFDKTVKNQNDLINELKNKIDMINNNINNNIITSLININTNITNSIQNQENKNEEKTTKNNLNINKNINIKNKINSNEKEIIENDNAQIDLNEKKDKNNFENKENNGETIYKFSILLNILIFILIAYLFFYFLQLKYELNSEKKLEEKLRNKMSILDFFDNLSDEEINYIELNIDKLKLKEEDNIKIKNKSFNINAGVKQDEHKINNPKTTISKYQKDIINKNETNNTNNTANNNEIDEVNNITKEKINDIDYSKESKIENNNCIDFFKNIFNEYIEFDIKNDQDLPENEEPLQFFKNKIKEKIKYKIKDIIFVLKFKSNSEEYNDFRDCSGISQNLIFIKTKGGKTIGLFTKNIIDILNCIKMNIFENNDMNFMGYIIDSQNIEEIYPTDFFNVYNSFISIFQKIALFLDNQENDNANEDGIIKEIEIYQVIYTI